MTQRSYMAEEIAAAPDVVARQAEALAAPLAQVTTKRGGAPSSRAMSRARGAARVSACRATTSGAAAISSAIYDRCVISNYHHSQPPP